jgi:hypothetical protein
VLYQGQYEPRFQLPTKSERDWCRDPFLLRLDVDPVGATGRLARIQLPAVVETARGKTVRMEYDDITGTADLVFPDGRHERTEHNPAGQPTRIVLVTPGALGGTAGDVLLEIVYSTAGRPVRVIYGNGIEGQMVHDEHGRTIRIEYRKGGVLLDSCRLRYDEGGHRAVIQYLGAPARSPIHRLDGRERLVEARMGFPLAPLPDVTASAAQAADVAAARIAAAGAPGAAFRLDDADVRTKVTGLNGGAANVIYVSAKSARDRRRSQCDLLQRRRAPQH